MDKNKISLLTIVLLSFATMAFVILGRETRIAVFVKEDGIVESLTALFFLASTVLAGLSAFKSKKIILPLAWTIACFFFLGEETSWFQRIFNYSVPAIEAVNAQNEFNFHNLNNFDHGQFTEGSDYLSDLFKSQNLFRMGFFGYFLIIPALLIIPFIKKLASKIGYIRPNKLFILSLLVVFISSFLLVFSASPVVKNALAETRELFYSMFIFGYIALYFKPFGRKHLK